MGFATTMATMLDFTDAAAIALMLLTVALFGMMIWAGNHSH